MNKRKELEILLEKRTWIKGILQYLEQYNATYNTRLFKNIYHKHQGIQQKMPKRSIYILRKEIC